MSDSTGTPTPTEGAAPVPITDKKSRKRVVEYGIIVVILGFVVALAAYQEPIGAFFRLHM